MNNFERQEAIDEMVAAHTPRELAGMVLDARSSANDIKAIAESLIASERHSAEEIKSKNKKIAGLKTKIAMQSGTIKDVREDYSSLLGSINKIKAEAIREWADQANPNNESEDRMVSSAYDYANELEQGK